MTAIAALGLTAFPSLGTAAIVETDYGSVELISEVGSVPRSGGTITVGFYLEPIEGWHAYWTNPGDAGLPVEINWTLPEGFQASDLQFPAPHVIPFGPLNTYGYSEAILLLAEIDVPDGVETRTARINASAKWLVCDDELCVPDSANLSLTLRIGDGEENPRTIDRFATARALLPEAQEWKARFNQVGEKINVRIEASEEVLSGSDLYMFPGAKRLVTYDEQTVSFVQGGVLVSMNADKQAGDKSALPLLLSYTDADGSQKSVSLLATKGVASAFTGAGAILDNGLNFWSAALYAFLGGMILNLMPCVFPILSMKALSLVNMANQNQSAARESGLLYTAGVLVAFAAIGAAILGFRAAGNAVYWGFQFQNGPVNMLVAMLMVVIGLNLLGVFEVGTRIMGVGQELTQGGERKSAFFTGLLAVVVATPCGAPFMATAIGFAFKQPSAILITIFLALGFGLAFPYLLLSFVPNIGEKLPKPGPWMESFKHVLAFPMFVAALYFFWVGGRVLGLSSMVAGLGTALALSFALWAYGKGAVSQAKRVWYSTAVVGLVATGWAYMQIDANKIVVGDDGEEVAGSLGGLQLENFDPSRVEQYIAGGQPVFVYFTADWCISCKVNERVALSTDTVADVFNEKGIKVVEGDWTLEDPAITDWLEMYDRAGVPLYLYFPKGSSLETVTILPQILTPGMVVDEIVAADAAAEMARRLEETTEADGALAALP